MPISEIANSPIVAEVVVPAAPVAALTADAYFSIGSQYVYRGVALRDSGPAVAAAFTISHRQGWFFDAWTGQVDARDYYDNSIAREWQVELSAGYAAQLSDEWQWSLARAWIDGIDTALTASQNYQEWRLNFFYREDFAMQFAYTDNYRQLGWSAWDAEIKYQYALTSSLGSEWVLGHSHGAGIRTSDYNYSSVGIQKAWLMTEWNLRWIYSSSDASYVIDADRRASRIELTLSWPLPISR